MSDEDEAEGPSYRLVMPLICCEDHGGPYHAPSFVAGARYAQVNNALRTIRPLGIATYAIYVEPELIPQLDLLAMHEGWTLKSEPWEDAPDEWTLATFAIGETAL